MKRKQLLIMFLVICLMFSQLLGTVAFAVTESKTQTSSNGSTVESTEKNLQSLSEGAVETENTDSSAIPDVSSSEETEQSKDELAEGQFGNSSWYIRNDFTLVIRGGEFTDTKGESPWISYKDKIQKILIEEEVTLSRESSHLFQGLSKLSEIDSIENLKIMQPTKLNYFFEGCEALKKVDFSKWDTNNVIENGDFLSSCENLEIIKLGTDSIFREYKDEKRQNQPNRPSFIWKGRESAKTFYNISELLSQNEGLPDDYYKELAPEKAEIEIKYLDENDKEIHESKKLFGVIGEDYDIGNDEYQLKIDGFQLDDNKLPETQGTFQEASRILIFQYKKIAIRSKQAIETPNVVYRSYIQSMSWQEFKKNGEVSGKNDQNKSLEAIEIKLENIGDDSGIEYRTATQDLGWEKQYSTGGSTAGSPGSGKKLEAIQIRLTGELAVTHDIFYRVSSETFGKLDWAKNGESAGTESLSCGLQSIEIKLVRKGSNELVSSPKAFVRAPSVAYRSHVESSGWQNYVRNGQQSGTSGQKKRLEGVQIRIENTSLGGNIQYRTHVQDSGWESSFKTNDEVSGTTGKAKRLEAIQIKLTGDIAKYFDVYYRVHAQGFGWLDWAKNGESAGTEGLAYRLESLQIKLIKKGSNELTSSPKAFVKRPILTYRSHVESSGWQNYVKDGQKTGTSGKAKRLEAIQVRIENSGLTGTVQYRTHIQNNGWESSFKTNNGISGTTGQKKRLEAIQIKLTEDIAQYFDVYYRAHVQSFGWLSWAKNGESAGTEGMGARMESLEIRLVPKGSNQLTSSSKAFVQAPTVSYRTHVQGIGWQNYVKSGQTAGTSGQSRRVEAIQIRTENNALGGGIQYRTHIQSNGWEISSKYNNAVSGTTGQAKRLEAIQIQLNGEIAKHFDVYYRVHAQNFGWLGWAKNGMNAGTEAYSYRLEAVQIKMVPKWGTPPSPTSNTYKKKPSKPTLSSFLGTTKSRIFNEMQRHQNDWYYLTTPFVGTLGNNASVMSPRGNPTIYGPGMNCTGFIATMTRNGGGNLSNITRKSNQYGGPCNGYNWRNALVPTVQHYSYRTVNDLLRSGKAEKGDLIYFEADYSRPNPDCHLGFFWGNNSSHDRIWHSTFPANKMSNIYSATPYSKVLLFKL
ncbi:MucBP domain-containing protein [Enterococcus pseudoavium]|uniref:MucBP domain-containing protein n=1 Tax=Enterococcus pseudoavium TaxID=44007 RepID=A0ABU3FGX4_9ENTE|nr:MucBP domain-containing protein [Enterococcus pseudoavium]MDT2754918.1 MucBP domain-containing protein [Enterococcus pseudoavium]MDT2770263.1 MucBP domain-containing protein [Enterococcus pseudoavium]